MTTFERIKMLAKERGLSIKELGQKLNFGDSTIYKWKNQTPNLEQLKKVSDYFDVSLDYLVGKSDKKHYYDLTEKDERDIEKELQRMIEDLSEGGPLAFSKEDGEMDETTRELLIASLENSLRFAKIEAKKRYTPKKYRGGSAK